MSGQSSSYAERRLERSDEFVTELKTQWRKMWRERIDDKVRAEGIAKEDYPTLFIECGTIIIATRRYKAPDFFEILEQHCGLLKVEKTCTYFNPLIGGWGSFLRSVLSKQRRSTKRQRPMSPKSEGKETLQKKKDGRGWIHRF